jgi:hypothetical protein
MSESGVDCEWALDQTAVSFVCVELTAATSLTLARCVLNVCRSEIYQVCKLVPGVPVHPMLAKPTKKITEVSGLVRHKHVQDVFLSNLLEFRSSVDCQVKPSPWNTSMTAKERRYIC